MKNLNFKNLTELEKAYIAGFLDGDGSIIAQIIHDKTRKYKFYIRISIVFYQKKDKHWFILWLKKKLSPYGYIRIRSDNISEFTIVAKEPVKKILIELYPYLKLKRNLCKLIFKIIQLSDKVQTEADFLKVCKKIDETAKLTYSKKRKITHEYVRDYLGSPVETSFSKN